MIQYLNVSGDVVFAAGTNDLDAARQDLCDSDELYTILNADRVGSVGFYELTEAGDVASIRFAQTFEGFDMHVEGAKYVSL